MPAFSFHSILKTSKLSLISLSALLLCVAGCDPVPMENRNAPYSMDRTAGGPIEYVQSKIMPEKEIVAEAPEELVEEVEAAAEPVALVEEEEETTVTEMNQDMDDVFSKAQRK